MASSQVLPAEEPSNMVRVFFLQGAWMACITLWWVEHDFRVWLSVSGVVATFTSLGVVQKE